VQALKSHGYFTGDEREYAASVSSLARQALTSGFDTLGATGTEMDPGAAEAGGALALGGLGPEVLGGLGAEAFGASAPPVGAAAQRAMALGHDAFADEVSRASLLISALRIGQSEDHES
jgi:hypothetical protein